MTSPADGQVRLGRDVAPNQDGLFEALRYGARDFWIGRGFGIDAKHGCVDLGSFVDGDNADFHFAGPGAHMANLEWQHRETVSGERVPMFRLGDARKQVRFYFDGVSIDGCARLPQHRLRDGEDPPPCFDVGNTFISRAVGLSVNDVPGSVFRLHDEVQCLRLIDCQMGHAGGSALDIEEASDLLVIGGNYERCLSIARWTGSTKVPYRTAAFRDVHGEQLREHAYLFRDVQGVTIDGGYYYGSDIHFDAGCVGNRIVGPTLNQSRVFVDTSLNEVDWLTSIDDKGVRSILRPSRDVERWWTPFMRAPGSFPVPV